MARKPSISNPNGEIEQHINTSYDVVKTVSDNIDELLVLVSFIEAGGGLDDHTLLSNIGTNTHDQIDTHITDSDIHFVFTKSATPPGTPGNGEFWLNTSTQELSIYANGVWENITYKSELAADAGALTINAGYF